MKVSDRITSGIKVAVVVDGRTRYGIVACHTTKWVSVRLNGGGYVLFGAHPWNVSTRPLADIRILPSV